MADKDLKQLINSLKTDGIEAAEAEAQTILTDARRQAEAVEAAAHKRKAEILAAAEQEASHIVEQGKQALQQAARDLKLALQQEIVDLLDTVFRDEVKQNFTAELIQSSLIPLLEKAGKEASLEVPDHTLEELSAYLRAKLAAKAEDIELRPNGKQSNSVRIRHTSAGWSYELSPETIAEALRPHLSQRWLTHLGEAS